MAKRNTKVLHTNIKAGLYETVKVTDARRPVPDVPAPHRLIRPSKRGSTWDCWISNSVMEFAAANPSAFSHPVLLVYTERSAVWIVDRKANGRFTHAFRHDLPYFMRKLIKKFDDIGRDKFVRYIIAHYPDGVKFTLLPHVRQTRAYSGPHTVTGTKKVRISRGAMRRAIDAGLLPNTAANRREALKQMRGPELVALKDAA